MMRNSKRSTADSGSQSAGGNGGGSGSSSAFSGGSGSFGGASGTVNIGGHYDVLFGVVTGESIWRFSAHDIQNGFEGERRDKIIRTYVRNAYNYHLNEIFYTVSTCYIRIIKITAIENCQKLTGLGSQAAPPSPIRAATCSLSHTSANQIATSLCLVS